MDGVLEYLVDLADSPVLVMTVFGLSAVDTTATLSELVAAVDAFSEIFLFIIVSLEYFLLIELDHWFLSHENFSVLLWQIQEV